MVTYKKLLDVEPGSLVDFSNFGMDFELVRWSGSASETVSIMAYPLIYLGSLASPGRSVQTKIPVVFYNSKFYLVLHRLKVADDVFSKNVRVVLSTDDFQSSA